MCIQISYHHISHIILMLLMRVYTVYITPLKDTTVPRRGLHLRAVEKLAVRCDDKPNYLQALPAQTLWEMVFQCQSSSNCILKEILPRRLQEPPAVSEGALREFRIFSEGTSSYKLWWWRFRNPPVEMSKLLDFLRCKLHGCSLTMINGPRVAGGLSLSSIRMRDLYG